jgi:hypothetical protein
MPCGASFNRRFGETYRVPLKRRFLQEAHGVNISEDGILHSHRDENRKSYTALTGWAL